MSQVPIGPVTYSPGKCTRITKGPVDAPTGFCLKDAVVHVFWDAEFENGFVCSDHLADIIKWKPYSTHASKVPPCGLTGSVFYDVIMEDGTVESWCALDDGDVTESAELVAALGKSEAPDGP